jgi:hypothetical protein
MFYNIGPWSLPTTEASLAKIELARKKVQTQNTLAYFASKRVTKKGF